MLVVDGLQVFPQGFPTHCQTVEEDQPGFGQSQGAALNGIGVIRPLHVEVLLEFGDDSGRQGPRRI